MKKYFKLGTALAFSVLLNLTPTLITNVKAEEQKNNSNITEQVNENEIYYANQLNFDDSSIPEEEPLEVKEAANEVSTAEANNIEVNEPARAPTEAAKNEEKEILQDNTSNNDEEVIPTKAGRALNVEPTITVAKTSDVTITTPSTNITNRTDKTTYNAKYKFNVDNYNGTLRLKFTAIPSTSSVTINEAIARELGGTFDGRTLIWYKDIEVNTLDGEGNNTTQEINDSYSFDLSFNGIQYTTYSFSTKLTISAEYTYLLDGVETTGTKQLLASKSITTYINVVDTETINIELTANKEQVTRTDVESSDGNYKASEPITYNLKYNFDITNYNGSATATTTVTLPYEVDTSSENTNIGTGTLDSTKKKLTFTKTANTVRCDSDGVCTKENVSDDLTFTLVFKNPTGQIKVSASSSINKPSAAPTTSSTKTATVTNIATIAAQAIIHYVDENGAEIEGVEPTVIDTTLGDTTHTSSNYRKTEELKNLYYDYVSMCKIVDGECISFTGRTLQIDNEIVNYNYNYKKYPLVEINYIDGHGNKLAESETVYTKSLKYADHKKDFEETNYFYNETRLDGVKTTSSIYTVNENGHVVDYVYEKRLNNKITRSTHVAGHESLNEKKELTYTQTNIHANMQSPVQTGDVAKAVRVTFTLDGTVYEAIEVEDGTLNFDFGTYDNPKFYYEQNGTSGAFVSYNPRFINEYENKKVDIYYEYIDTNKDYKININYYFLDEDSLFLNDYHFPRDDIEDVVGTYLSSYLYNLGESLYNNNLTSDETNGVRYYERETLQYKANELVDHPYKYNSLGQYVLGDYWQQVFVTGVDEWEILPIQRSIGIEISEETYYDENNNPRGAKIYGEMIHSDLNYHVLLVVQSKTIVNHILVKNGVEEELAPSEVYSHQYDSLTRPYNGRERVYAPVIYIKDRENIDCIGFNYKIDNYYGQNYDYPELRPAQDIVGWLDYPRYSIITYNYYYVENGNLYIHHVDTDGNPITVDKLGNEVISYFEYRDEVGKSYEDKLGAIEIPGYVNISTNTTDSSNEFKYTKEPIHVFYVYDVLKYNLNFVTNGGSPVDSEVLEYNTPVTISNYNTERVYYYFDGWYRDENFEVKAVDFNITEDTTLYAKWIKPSDYPDTPQNDWDVSKSKTATPLDENLETEIEIALPSSKEELETTVVFVIDNSSSTVTEAIAEAQSVVDTLMEQVRESGAKVNIAVVAFKGDAKVLTDLVVLTEDNINEVKAAIAEGYSNGSGSNVHAGLIEADKLLDMSDIASNRKYMILLTDGITRNFTGSDGNAKNIYYDFDNQKYWGEMSSWASVRGVPEGNYKVPGDDWNEYYQKVKTWVEQDQDAYVEDFKDYTGNGKPDSTFNKTYAPEGFTYIPRGEKEHAFAVDRAIYEAYEKYKEIEAKGYHLYSVQTKNYPLGKAFLEALNNGKSLSFQDIRKDILYLVDKGSVVKDYIGEDFTFVNGENPFTIKIDDEELVSTKVDDNTYTFRKADDEEGTYRHKVTYYDVENGYIVWNINETIDNFTRVKLLFKEKLTNYTTEVLGTIPTDTNIVATITPVDSEGNEGETETFEKPVVEYVIGNVIANYVDTEGNTLADSEEYRGIVNIETYETVAKEIPLYHLIRIEDENDVTGKYQNETITVTYVYAKDNGKVIIHYIDKNGVTIHADNELEGPVGSPYNTNTAEVKVTSHEEILGNGYKYLTSTGKVEGTFTSERPINVTYIYEKLGKVIVKFLDKDTEEVVATEETLTGDVGDSYATSSKQVELYDLYAEPENKYGEYQVEDQEVIYYYVKHKGTVITHYVDVETNEEIADQEIQSERIGNEYTTTILENIDNYTFVRNTENITGNYTVETIDVYYYYQKQSGDVKAIYVDALTGETIAEEYTNHGYVDETYETPQKEIGGYRFVRVEGQTSGNYENGKTIEVTYYYTQADKIGHVIIKYQDIDGNPLANDIEKSGIVGQEYSSDAKEFSGYYLTEMPNNANGPYTEESMETPIEVIYVYEKEGKVITHYVDTNGNDLANPTTQTGKVGDEYTTTAKDIPNYELVGEPSNKNGEYQAEITHVIYVYDLPKEEPNNCCNNCCNTCTGTSCNSCSNSCTPYLVITRYEDEDGNTIAQENVEHVAENAQYATIKKQIEGYEFVKVSEDSDPTEGTYIVPEEGEAEPIRVTYIYKKLPVEEPTPEPVKEEGILVVHYVDENGATIADDVITSEVEGTKYVTSQKAIEGYTFTSVTDNYKGTYNNDIIEVIYTYKKNEVTPEEPVVEPKTSYVVVKYVDENGQEIAEKVILSGKVGEFYFTTQKQIDGYIFVEVDSEEEGQYTEDIKRVVYSYKKVEEEPVTPPVVKETGILVVRYVDENGSRIADDEITSEEEGTKYVTSQKVIEGYTYESVTDNYKGTYDNSIIEVIYTYTKNEEEPVTPPVVKETGILVVRYVDENGATIANDEITSEEEGTKYVTSQKAIESYTFTSVTDNYKGTYNNDIIEVIYTYKKNEVTPEEPVVEPKTSYVVVKYIDENGQEIAEKVILSGKVGEFYFTTQKQIDGYIFVEVDSEEEGQYTEDIKRVVYSYKKVEEEPVTPPVVKETGILVVRYVDENGATIANDEITSEEEGTKYVTSQKAIEGYTFTSVTDNYKGTYNNDIIEVIYTYKKNEVTPEEPVVEPKTSYVVVKYVDENGQEIAEKVILSGKVGENYFANQKQISNYNFVSVDQEEEGYFTEEIIRITYTYEKQKEEEPVPVIEKKDVTILVQYLDQKTGNPVFDSVALTGKEGETYTTTRKPKEGYNLVSPEFEELGTFTESTTLTYYYEKVVEEEKEQAIILVQYIDKETNNTVFDSETITGYIGDLYILTRKSKEGYTIENPTFAELGEFATRLQVFTYYYNKIEEQPEEPVIEKKDVTILVQYLDVETGNPVFDSVTLTGKEGTNYTTTRKAKEGYNLLTPEFEELGVYSESVVLNYYYEKEVEEVVEQPEEAIILVHYTDSNGNPIKSDEVVKGNVGDTYVIPAEVIPGYNLVDIQKVEPTPVRRLMMLKAPAPTSKANIGTFTSGVTEINFIYEEIEEEPQEEPKAKEPAMLIVRYQDTNGTAIAEDEVTNGLEGDFYNAKQKVLTGYKYVNVDSEETYGTLNAGLTVITYTYEKLPEEQPSNPDEPNCGCNNSCCCNNCNNGNEGSTENNQPVINIDININNENNSDNHSENNSENNIENNSDNHSENNQDTNVNNDTNVDTHNDINNDNHTDVNNDTNVDNHNDNSTEVNNDNSTDVNNENNNQDENNINIENNPTQTNENNNDNSIENNPVNTNENNNDGSIENDSTNNNQSNSENQNDNSSSSSSDNNNTSENNNENNPTNNNDGSNSNENINNNENTCTENCETTCKDDTCEKEEENPPVVEDKKYGVIYTHYIDTKGNKLDNDKVETLEVGSEYSTVKESFEGYNYVTVINNTNGIVKEGEIDVTYLYQAIPEEVPSDEPEEETGTVVVYYIDTEGNTLNEKVVMEDEVGKTYLTDQKTFEGYDFATLVGNKNGEVKKGITEVTYIYKKATTCEKEECQEKPVCPSDDPCPKEEKNGKVVARYIDNEGNTLTEEIITEDKVGENYVTIQKTFEGYDFVTVTGNRSGKYIDGVVEVTYIYENKAKETPACPGEDSCKPEVKQGKVIAHYVDTEGNMLGYDIEQVGNVDEKYTTKLRKFKGYTFTQVVGAYAGVYKEGTIEVTYIYKKDKEEKPTPIDKDKTTPPKEEEHKPVKEQGTTTGIEITRKDYYTSIQIPNTGIRKEKNLGLFSLIMSLIATVGILVARDNEQRTEEE